MTGGCDRRRRRLGSAAARAAPIENGARPDLAGRAQPSTRRRAEAAGMIGTDEGQIAGQNIVLSIGPPAEALALA